MKAVISFRALTAVVVVMAGAMIASGSSINSIGVLNPGTGTAESAVRAISPDGQYAVGYSNGTATVYDLGGNPSTFTGQVPVIWTAGTLTQLPMTADNFLGVGRGTNTVATGVLVRYNTALSRDEIAIGGGFLQVADPFKWQMCSYRAPLNNLGSGIWSDSTLGSNAAIVAQYNSTRVRTTQAGSWFVAGDRSGSVKDFNMGLTDFNSGTSYEHNGHKIGTETWDAVSNGVNGAGRSAGYIKASGLAPDPITNPRRATFLSGVNTDVQTPLTGGSQFDSEAVGISPDPNNIILCGFDFSDTTHSKAFVCQPVIISTVPLVYSAEMTLLDPLAGDTLAGAIDVRLISGNYITAGYSSDGTTERAVIWDTTGKWDSTGQAILVSDVLSNDGVDISEWTSLTRITSMSDDGKTVAGYGIWAADGSTRGFVAQKLIVSQITARNIFYNNSWFDNYKTTIDAGTGTRTDTAAIDTSKTPLIVGNSTKATFDNWTGYNKGINGLIYDVLVGDGKPDPVAGNFTFTNTGPAGTGTTAVSPAASGVIVLNAGVPGNPANQRKVRMVFTFTDSQVKNAWMKVVISTAFGLASAETHYWGNVRGDVNFGNSSTQIAVNAQDELKIRGNPSGFTPTIPSNVYDINKDRATNASDELWVRGNGTGFAPVTIITK